MVIRRAAWVACCVGCASLVGIARAQDGESPVTLRKAVRVAVENHLAIAIARTQLRSSEAALSIARAGRLPVVSGVSSATASRSAGSRTFFFGPEPVPVAADQRQERFDSRLTLRETFYNGGLLSVQARQARAQMSGAEHGYEAARQDIVLGVIVAYFGHLEAVRLHEVTMEQVGLAERNLEATQARIDAGVLAPADIYQFRAQLAQARINEIQARNNVRQAATALRQAMGLDLGPPLEIAETVKLVDPEYADEAVADLVSRALKLRPELLETRASALLAQHSRRITYINSNPRLTLSGLGNWEPGSRVSTSRPGDPPQVSQSVGTDFSLTLQYIVPIFDFGVGRAQQRQADASMRAAQLREQQLVRDTAVAVETAYLALVNAREQLEATAAGEQEARVALEAAEAKFSLGLATPLELIDAQVRHFNAQVVHVRTQYSEQVALARLARGLGDIDAVLEEPPEDPGE